MIRKKTWVYSPPKPPKPKVPESLKDQVKQVADEIIETEFKPKYIKKPPNDNQYNYVVDIHSKWIRSYFYFIARYRCPSPNCLSEFFEIPFARMEYVGGKSFNLSYMRHTGKWWEIYQNLSLNKCIEAIRNDPSFIV